MVAEKPPYGRGYILYMGSPGMSDYDTDILTWSERQADLLRRVGAGELVKDNEVDWGNVAEEIEDVGRSQLAQVKSLLVQAILHGLKAEAWPLSGEVPHWEAEARGFRDDAADSFTPSMRHGSMSLSFMPGRCADAGDNRWPGADAPSSRMPGDAGRAAE